MLVLRALTMKEKTKDLIGKLVSTVSLAALAINIMVVYMSPPVQAATIDDLCIPDFTEISGGNFILGGWVELSFRNRAEITMRLVGETGCPNNEVSPDGLKFDEIVQGYMVDKNTADPTMRYLQRKGERSADDSRIDNFDEEGRISGEISDFRSGRDKKSPSFASSDRTILKGVEFTLSFEDSLAGSITTCGANSNFGLGKEEGGGGDVEWRCVGEGSGDIRGARVREQIKNLPNFNIAYNYIGDEVVHVSEDERNKRTFKRMTGSAGDADGEHYRSEGGTGPLWLEVTKEQLDGIGSGTLDAKLHDDDESGSVTTVIAGADNPSSTASDANPDNNGGSGRDDEEDCDAESGLTWIICGTVRLVRDALEKAGTVIEDLLLSDPKVVQQGSPAYRSWKGFRDLANVGLVLVFVIIIYSQATGGKS